MTGRHVTFPSVLDGHGDVCRGIEPKGVTDPDLAGVASPLDLSDLLLGALAPQDGGATGYEEVSALAVGDLDNVAGEAKTRDLARQYELHDMAPQRAVEVYGNPRNRHNPIDTPIENLQHYQAEPARNPALTLRILDPAGSKGLSRSTR